MLAITSHVPHLIAYNIVGTAADLEDVTQSEVMKFSAGGFRDFTRIAASDPTMWRDVFLHNKDAVLEMLGRFSEDLTALQRMIRRGDGDGIVRALHPDAGDSARHRRPGPGDRRAGLRAARPGRRSRRNGKRTDDDDIGRRLSAVAWPDRLAGGFEVGESRPPLGRRARQQMDMEFEASQRNGPSSRSARARTGSGKAPVSKRRQDAPPAAVVAR